MSPVETFYLFTRCRLRKVRLVSVGVILVTFVQIITGVRVFIGSKHTWESQYLLANGTSGKTLIASDGIWFYYNLQRLLPIPTYTYDAQAYVRAMQRMKTLVDKQDLIISGHDALVLDKFPRVADRVAKIELVGK